MLTARDEDVDKIIGLESGRTTTSRSRSTRLVARVKSVLRRATSDRRIDEGDEIRHGDLLINSGRREVLVGDDEIAGPKEFEPLWELLDHRGIVLTRDQLLERVWGYTFAGDTRTVDVRPARFGASSATRPRSSRSGASAEGRIRAHDRARGVAQGLGARWNFRPSTGWRTARPRSGRSQDVPVIGSASCEPRPCGTLSSCPGSLRLRLPALFLLGIVLAGVVSAIIAVRALLGSTAWRSYEELGREARGIARLYGDAALRPRRARPRSTSRRRLRARDRRPAVLRRRAGRAIRPGAARGSSVPAEVMTTGRQQRFEFRPPGRTRTFLAVSQPLRLEPDGARRNRRRQGAGRRPRPVGAARRPARDRLRHRRTARLAARLPGSHSGSAGPSRLSPARPTRSPGELRRPGATSGAAARVSHLSERFNEMAARLAATEERNASSSCPCPTSSERPSRRSRDRRRAPRRARRRPELIGASLEVVANEATRLERLVGDVLDLAKLRAHRFTVQTEEVDMGRLVEQAYGSFGDEARRREIDYALQGAESARRSSRTAIGCSR